MFDRPDTFNDVLHRSSVLVVCVSIALMRSSRLWDQGLSASVGVTTGVVFCGVVGATMRKEYTVLGDTVNLSARLMQYACVNGGGVVCDQQVCAHSSYCPRGCGASHSPVFGTIATYLNCQMSESYVHLVSSSNG